MAHILVVANDPAMSSLILPILEAQRYQVVWERNGKAALEWFAQRPWDLVLLDVCLPGLNGWQICTKIREQSQVPILFVTGVTGVDNVVRGLRLGADDYVEKPFHRRIFQARVEALLRRSAYEKKEALASGRGLPQPLTYGDLVIDPSTQSAQFGAVSLPLSPVEFRLLAALVQAGGCPVSGQALVRTAHGYEVSEDETGSLLRVHIFNLRRKLEAAVGKRLHISTARGFGYRVQVLGN